MVMIKNPVIFTQEQIEVISTIKTKEDFGSNSWSCEEFKPIKTIIRKHYVSEQKSICSYCQMDLKTKGGRSWDVEHIIPRVTAPNFMFEPLNLCVSCVDCNIAKSTSKVTKSTAKITYPTEKYTIIHPHFDVYKEHICTIKPGVFYVPRTDKGEYTMYVCKLLRFHAYANYDDSLDDLDDEIELKTNNLRDTKSEKNKARILKDIMELVIRRESLETE